MFRSGEATPVEVDLDRELARNPRLKEFVAGRIEQDLAERAAAGDCLNGVSGAVWVDSPLHAAVVFWHLSHALAWDE